MKDISEAKQSAKVVRKILEKDVQNACVEWARNRGYWARKFSSQSQRSVPDYLFSLWPKSKFACEFKAPGKTSTDAQIDEQEAMRLVGWFVFECDNLAKFKAIVLAYEAEQV
jgi:hypothetical protein